MHPRSSVPAAIAPDGGSPRRRSQAVRAGPPTELTRSSRVTDFQKYFTASFQALTSPSTPPARQPALILEAKAREAKETLTVMFNLHSPAKANDTHAHPFRTPPLRQPGYCTLPSPGAAIPGGNAGRGSCGNRTRAAKSGQKRTRALDRHCPSQSRIPIFRAVRMESVGAGTQPQLGLARPKPPVWGVLGLLRSILGARTRRAGNRC